jgi:agmatine deiminase
MAKAQKLRATPASLGFTFPPEWHRHSGTWLSWPRPEGISFPDRYHTVPAAMAAIVRQIAKRERVHINVPNGNWERIVKQQLRQNRCPTTNVRFHHIPTNESWCRDHGPAFVLRKNRGKTQAAIVDWGFNAWGGKYPPYDADDAVPTRIAEELKLPVFNPGIIMEGGAVDFDGRGSILTTTSCLLNKNRNPGLSQRQIEKYLLDYYGQQKVLWLGDGIAGDDTDGHVDDLARFINPTTIVTAVEPDPSDANYRPLKENLRRLAEVRDGTGKPYKIVTIPMPAPIWRDGLRLPATYVNFYFVNGALLVPTFRQKARDAKALAILQEQLPRHRIIGIDCYELIWGLGAIHCLTQQMPAW